MAFQSQFFRAGLLTRTAASVLGWLMVCGSPGGLPAQAPAPATAAKSLQVAAAAAVPPSGESTQGSLQVQDLLASLARFDRDGRDPAHKLGFELPERAINEYLAYILRTRPRPGISALTVTLLPNNEVAGVVEMDFGAITQWNAEILPEPLRPLLKGKQTLRVNARFESRSGTFTVTVKDVRGPDGNPLPAKLVTDLMQSIGSRQPEAYDPAKPMPLPFGLKRVWTTKQSVCGET